MSWIVKMSPKAQKSYGSLPKKVKDQVQFLMGDIEQNGPVRGDWPNYGKIGKNRHHCHLKKGHPTYVAVWAEYADGVRIAEIEYVGTHERAPY
ncbi:MAG: cytotoxic translational repressor of toxin-antitoxin stability system [Deltaproteobacteria bacterium]|jgi:mRNA-degrading endonuclease RelE of RelBE toxin-antitoxin system|nr:cytotoxic translational repressor of toxin-antitoxin stability system [Deltaproteobacteria bacterium]